MYFPKYKSKHLCLTPACYYTFFQFLPSDPFSWLSMTSLTYTDSAQNPCSSEATWPRAHENQDAEVETTMAHALWPITRALYGQSSPGLGSFHIILAYLLP